MLNEWTPQMCKTNLLTAGVCKVEFDKCILALSGMNSTAKATRLNHRYEPLDFLPSRIIPWEFNRNVNKRPCAARNKTLLDPSFNGVYSGLRVILHPGLKGWQHWRSGWEWEEMSRLFTAGRIKDRWAGGCERWESGNVVSARQQPQICESLVRFVHVISLFNCACCTNADHLLNSPPC